MKRLLSLLGLLIVALSTFDQTFTVGDMAYTALSATIKDCDTVHFVHINTL